MKKISRRLFVAGARPLAKNAYKIPLTSAIVKQTLLKVGASA